MKTPSRTGMRSDCIACTFFRKAFFALARLGLAFVKRFFSIGLAADRFAVFPRADLGVLRELPRTAPFPLLLLFLFFGRAMFAAYAVRPKRAPSPVLAKSRRKQACDN